jgi:hypothetical protein
MLMLTFYVFMQELTAWIWHIRAINSWPPRQVHFGRRFNLILPKSVCQVSILTSTGNRPWKL